MESTLNNNFLDRHFEVKVNEQHVLVEYQEDQSTINLIYTHMPRRLIVRGVFRIFAESMAIFLKSTKVKLIPTGTPFTRQLLPPEHSRLFKEQRMMCSIRDQLQLPDRHAAPKYLMLHSRKGS